MQAYCLNDGKPCDVHYADFKNEIKYNAKYQLEMAAGTIMLLIPTKEKIPKHKRYMFFKVGEDICKSIFVR